MKWLGEGCQKDARSSSFVYCALRSRDMRMNPLQDRPNAKREETVGAERNFTQTEQIPYHAVYGRWSTPDRVG